MKYLVLLLTVIIPLSIFGQTQNIKLTAQQKQKAIRNAELEIKNLPKKGWKSNRSDMSFEQMFNKAWILKFSMINSKTPTYIYTFGNATAKTADDAYAKAEKKAKAQLPGLILMYFNMWNMASDLPQDEKDIIQSAIGKSEGSITKALESLKIEPLINIIRPKGSKTEIHLRYYYPQMASRNIAKNLIIKELSKTTDWSKSKMNSVLTYEK